MIFYNTNNEKLYFKKNEFPMISPWQGIDLPWEEKDSEKQYQ